MKTKTSETENVKVQYSEAETLDELRARMPEGEIVKLANDYINRHHFLPDVRTALRGEVTAKTDEGKAKQAATFAAMKGRVEAGEVFDLYEFTPTRREAKENKTAVAVDAALAKAKADLIAKLIVNGKTEEEANSIAAMF